MRTRSGHGNVETPGGVKGFLNDGWDSKGGSMTGRRGLGGHERLGECGARGFRAFSRSESYATAGQNILGQLRLAPRVEVTVTLAPWFALRVRRNYEKPVAAALRGKGFQEFL